MHDEQDGEYQQCLSPFPIENVLFLLVIPLKYNFLIQELDFLIQKLCYSRLSLKDNKLEFL